MAKRRSKGDGGLYQRHDHPDCPPVVNGERPAHKCQGRWVGNVEVLVDGVPKRKSVYGRTKKEAQVKLAKALNAKASGTLIMRTLTVEKWLDYWLEEVVDLKPQTRRGYRSKIRCYLKPFLGRHRLTSLRPEHIRALHSWMYDADLSDATVRQTHAIMRKALRDAMNEDKVATNVADRVKAPSSATVKRRPLTADQARRVLAEAGDDARWWLALFYGMRQGECLGLRWCDVDLDALTLRIQQTLQTDDDYRVIFGPPKSEAGTRYVPLLPWIESRLRLHRLDTPESHAPRCDGITGQCEHGLVFTHAGKPIWPNVDWEAWRDLLVAATQPPLAPIPHVALHAARNSAASLMEAARVPDRMVAQILGHSQVQITHGYQRAELEQMRQALTQAGGILELE